MGELLFVSVGFLFRTILSMIYEIQEGQETSHQISDQVTEITWLVDFSPSLKTLAIPKV